MCGESIWPSRFTKFLSRGGELAGALCANATYFVLFSSFIHLVIDQAYCLKIPRNAWISLKKETPRPKNDGSAGENALGMRFEEKQFPRRCRSNASARISHCRSPAGNFVARLGVMHLLVNCFPGVHVLFSRKYSALLWLKIHENTCIQLARG